jgi:hypothetical protein
LARNTISLVHEKTLTATGHDGLLFHANRMIFVARSRPAFCPRPHAAEHRRAAIPIIGDDVAVLVSHRNGERCLVTTAVLSCSMTNPAAPRATADLLETSVVRNIKGAAS